MQKIEQRIINLDFKEIKPFGPSILKFQMPQEVVDSLNASMDFITNNKLEAALDHSDSLAGKVSQEITIPHETLVENADFFFNAANEFAYKVHENFKSDQSDHHVQGLFDEEKEDISLRMSSAWFVRSYAGDYNPLHLHPGCQLASFGYLQLPDWESEVSSDSADHFGLTHGCSQFAYGSGGSQNLVRSTYTVKPKVGDFYIFPAWLNHCVYPFRTEGERRSLAINYSILKNLKEST